MLSGYSHFGNSHSICCNCLLYYTCHRLQTGEIFFYDAQKGYFVELGNFLENAISIELLKVDKLYFNIDIVAGVLESF